MGKLLNNLGGLTILFGIAMAKNFFYAKIEEKKSLEVDAHIKNLLKGGLIPKVEKEVHWAAMRKIGTEHPNIKLPRREYY